MPEQNITNIPSNRVEFIDPRTGMVSREWYRFFLNLFNLAGAGGNQTSLDDLQVGPPPVPDSGGGGGGGSGTVTSVAMSVPTGLSVAGSPVTTAGTFAVTYSAGYAIPTTAKQTEWDTAYADRLKWDGGATDLVAATGRTSLGATTVGSNFFTLADPSAITFVQINADNSITTMDAPTFRTAIGAGTGGGDVVGPASATDNAVARYDTTTGKLIQNSLVLIDDTGSVTGVNALTAESLTVNNNATLGFSNTDTLDVRSRIISDLEPNTNNAKDIGSSGRNWRDGFFGRNLSTVNFEVTGTTSFDGQQGTSGQVLTSAGTGATPTWTTPTTGTVTSVGGTGTVSGLTLTGTVTTSGNLTLGGTLVVTPSDFASQSANTFLAAPNGSAGVPTFRGIVAADVPALSYVSSVGVTAPLATTGGLTPTLSMPVATSSANGYLSSTDWSTFNAKQPAGAYLTSVAVTSANGFAGTSSGGTTPSLTLTTSITGLLKGNGTAMSAATAGTDYSAGTSALATGILKSTTTTGALTIAVAADFPTLNQNTTGTASNVTGTVAIANGGTGQTTQTAAFDALSPATTKGDLIVDNGTNNVRLAVGTDTYVLTADATTATGLKWAAPSGGGSNITALGLWENSATISANYTIGTGNNAMSAGRISVASGVTVTVPTGSTWSIV
ncbi:hypothetical protein K0U83_03085 [bacterium]|nr:hypothetical protein [bacterium]